MSGVWKSRWVVTKVVAPTASLGNPPGLIRCLTHSSSRLPSACPFSEAWQPPPSRAATGDFNGGVDVGGRKIHLECKGAGAPSVILISGYRNNAEIWTVEPAPGLTPVFAAVAQFTRVCAYDRPGTVLDADHLSRSDPVPMPRSADAIVAELHALLDAAGTKGPYVLAAHSLGGLFARLYAATYPEDVAGMVLVDAWQEDLDAILGPAQWAAYVELATPAPPGLDRYADLEFGRLRRCISADARSGEIGPASADASHSHFARETGAASTRRAGCLLTRCVRGGMARGSAPARRAPSRRAPSDRGKSDHYVQIGQPALVVAAIRAVVDAVRDPASWRN